MSLVSFLIACASYENTILSQDRASDTASYGGAADEESYDAPDASQEPEDNADTGFDDGLGSETETASPFLLPATTSKYVFVANPDRNTVTRITVDDLSVITANVGVNPTLVNTSSDYTKAITFNSGSSSISIIDAQTMEVTEVPVRENLNQMKMSSDGKWVICYHNRNVDDGSLSNSGAISFNAISIVNLETLEHTEAIVGSNPHDVQYSADTSKAIVIADDYLSILDLNAETILPKRIALADDLVTPPRAEEVLLAPSGTYALIRQYGVDQLVLVDLEAEENEVSMLAVGANPTDMDVSKDGTKAFVVARVAKEIWVYDLVDIMQEPIVLPLPEEEVFGSLLLSPAGDKGLLYSTVSGQSHIGIWDRNTDEITTRSLVKPVSGVEISPSSDTAIIFHDIANGDTTSDSYFYNHYAISLLDVNDLFSSSYQLSGEPASFAHTSDGAFGFYTMKNLPYLEILDYENFVPQELLLPSNPIHLGALPDTNTIFISQEHNLGRISFFDSETEKLETITGFELNSAIE